MTRKNTAKSEPSSSRKRPRDDDDSKEPEPEDVTDEKASLSLEENFMFNDTLVALRMMRAQFPRIDKVSVEPFVLRSQLYSSVKDRTQVDRDLEALRRDRVLRIFKLNTGQDDHAIMFVDDYSKQEGCTEKSITTSKFLSGLRRMCCSPSWIPASVTTSFLYPSFTLPPWYLLVLKKCLLLSLGGNVKEEYVSQLINVGLLIRQLADQNMYWFSIPSIGSVLKGLSQGRKELMSFLNRRKYKEMMMATLEKKRLRFSPLDMRFHLRDLIGSGHLKTFQTPTGLIVRVVKD